VVTGLVLGVVQALFSRRRLPLVGWTVATSVGVGIGIGLTVGSTAVGRGTGLGQLALQGALTGLVIGRLQALVLPASLGLRRWAWAAAAPGVWAVGWAVTTAAGVDVDRQFTVFGATGSLTWAALTGLLLAALGLPARTRPDRPLRRTAGR